jgi:hypothetical protein
MLRRRRDRAGEIAATFPFAGQPDLIRAAQKDEFYVQARSTF